MKHRSELSPSDTLLTVKQIATLDSCSEKTVRRAIDAGLLEAIKIGPGGRLLRVRPSAHEVYRRSQRPDRCGR
jgi:excisionase family DNA binding protein